MIPRSYSPAAMTELMPLVVSAAYLLLPSPMRSDRASAMLIAIALQESKMLRRRQLGGGPARGLWQFERSGLRGVMAHSASCQHFANMARNCRYPLIDDVDHMLIAVEHNDIFACAVARLLLWTDAEPLPGRDNPASAWQLYLRTWNPGKPRPEGWAASFSDAWDMVDFNHLELR